MEHMMTDLCMGIDLGTTNSAAAIIDERGNTIRAVSVPIERPTDINKLGGFRPKRENTIPSAVFYQKELDYAVIVGDAAKERAKIQNFSTALSVKSQMGNERLSYPNWDPKCPDQTPHDVSARILTTILNSVESFYFVRPDRAVITVPASYSVAQRNATKLAAAKAGLSVSDEMFLSEPEAVMYCALHQQDFSTPKNVLVYDIGGGTLDITLHQVQTAPDNPELFRLRGLATNRYSTTAGDVMDQKLAELMYRKYLDAYADEPDMHRQIQNDRDAVMSYLKGYAAKVKEEASDHISSAKKRGLEVPRGHSYQFGGIMPRGYSYEDYITREEIESCLRPLMGWEHTFADYKKFPQLPVTADIIYPVLDVLHRAAKKLNTPDITVDMVILNGGMSKLYMIVERLNEFFGFRVTSISDPDLSVSKGAAIYHYYLQQGKKLMNRVGFEDFKSASDQPDTVPGMSGGVPRGIQTVSNTLNESLYFGLRNAATPICIAEAGQDLPYVSKEITGLRMEGGVFNRFEFPIQEKHGDAYTTIASGVVCFPAIARKEMNVSLIFKLSLNGVLSIHAKTDMGEREVEISLSRDSAKKKSHGTRVIAPSGAVLQPYNEIGRLKNLVQQLDKREQGGLHGTHNKSEIIRKIHSSINAIRTCGNPGDFSTPILRELESCFSKALERNLITLSRHLCQNWTDPERKILAAFARRRLRNAVNNLSMNAFDVNLIKSHILVLSVCGNTYDRDLLMKLSQDSRYRSELLVALSRLGVEPEWIVAHTKNDLKANSPAMQESLKAMGVLLVRNPDCICASTREELMEMLMNHLQNTVLQRQQIVLIMGNLGLLYTPADDWNLILRDRILDAVNHLSAQYKTEIMTYINKAMSLLTNRLNGMRSNDDDLYLLELFSPEGKEEE